MEIFFIILNSFTANPCRCSKKTKGLIGEGKADGKERKFTSQTIHEVQAASPQANQRLDQLMEGKYLHFFMDQPYEQTDAATQLVNTLLFDTEIKELFRLN